MIQYLHAFDISCNKSALGQRQVPAHPLNLAGLLLELGPGPIHGSPDGTSWDKICQPQIYIN